MSFDIGDWVIEAASPGESKPRLCSEPSRETNGHDQSMYAWETAMAQASQLTNIPPPWEEDPRYDLTNTNDAYDATLPLLSADELFASDDDDVSTLFPPSITDTIVPNTSTRNQRAAAATAKIHTNPAQISSARKAAVQRKCTVRKAKLRKAHLDRITRLKSNKSQRVIIDEETINDNNACSGAVLQTPAPADIDNDTMHSSPPYLTPAQHDLIDASDDGDFEIDLSDYALSTTPPPPYTYPQLIRLALLSSPSTPLSSVQIRNWILDTFAYYRHADVPWRRGVNACLGAGAGEGVVKVGGEGEGGEKWRVVG